MSIDHKKKTILSIALLVAGFAIVSLAMAPVAAFAVQMPPQPPTPREVMPPHPPTPRSAMSAQPSGCDNLAAGWHWDWHTGHWHWHPGTWHWHPGHWTCNHNPND